MFPVNIIGKPPQTSKRAGISEVHKDDIKVDTRVESHWFVPTETPVAFVYNRRNYAVLLATPDNIVDYATGFSLTEGLINNLADIVNLDIVYSDQGIDLRFRLGEAALERFDVVQRRRNLAGNSGCGLCGLENADSLFMPLPLVTKEKVKIAPEAISRAMNDFRSVQKLNQKTRSVHGAAWVKKDGAIMMVREDVGRHNALDKLLGALALDDIKIEDGFVLLSSRCSYELVEKAARRGVTAIVSISAPTDFALQKANQAGLTLYAKSSNGAVEMIS